MIDVDAFRRRVHQVNISFAGDPGQRRYHMERLRDEYFAGSIAERLRKLPRLAGSSEQDIRAEAEQILRKGAQHSVPHDPHRRRRTSEEERFLNSAKVAWHKLLKTEGVAAARPRSKSEKLTELTGADSELRRLAKLQSKPDEGAAVLREYVAKHARHLTDVCNHAKTLNPRFLSTELEHALTRLYAIASHR